MSAPYGEEHQGWRELVEGMLVHQSPKNLKVRERWGKFVHFMRVHHRGEVCEGDGEVVDLSVKISVRYEEVGESGRESVQRLVEIPIFVFESETFEGIGEGV